MLKKDRELLKQIAGNMEASQSEIKTLVETLVALSEKSENEKNEATQVNTEQVVEALKILAEKSENNGLKDYSETSQLNNEKMVSMLNKLIEATENNGIKELTQASREGIKSLTEAMEKQTTRMLPQTIKGNEFTDNEKLIAAYALNLCTVSISQIIDYNDIYILEQEYEAILNNLNLEKMPKDEALLNILKQILDTVTFFRIQEGEKVLQEKKYQHQMKNAIWNAVPNLGVVIASGDPKAMALSLVTQVGAGYMNYRKEKAKIQLEHEEEKWKLQRSAIEQFNGLRRELFDTSWRLAKEYGFKEEYRLTEHQISQYNAILMDTNPIRRYERLESIEKYFEAYLPYWYYRGSAAYEIFKNENVLIELQTDFKDKAKKSFKRYFELEDNGCELLRNNQITAVCALEYVEFLANAEKYGDIETNKDKYLEKALKNSVGCNDIINICAMQYLNLGRYDKAAELFKELVNEGYNTSLNTYILSSIYVNGYLQIEDKEYKSKCYLSYKTLEAKLKDTPDKNSLMQWLELSDDAKKAQEAYLEKQKYIYAITHANVLLQIIKRYETKFELIRAEIENFERKDVYESIGRSFIDLYNDMIDVISSMNFFTWDEKQKSRIRLLEVETIKDNDSVSEIYKKYTFDFATHEFFEHLIKEMCLQVKTIKDMQILTDIEKELLTVCNQFGFEFFINDFNNVEFPKEKIDEKYISYNNEQTQADKSSIMKNNMKETIKKHSAKIEKTGAFKVLTDDVNIREYLTKTKRKSKKGKYIDIIAVIDKITDGKDNVDVLLAVEGFCVVKKKKYDINKVVEYSKLGDELKVYEDEQEYGSIVNLLDVLVQQKGDEEEKNSNYKNIIDLVNKLFFTNKNENRIFNKTPNKSIVAEFNLQGEND